MQVDFKKLLFSFKSALGYPFHKNFGKEKVHIVLIAQKLFPDELRNFADKRDQENWDNLICMTVAILVAFSLARNALSPSNSSSTVSLK